MYPRESQAVQLTRYYGYYKRTLLERSHAVFKTGPVDDVAIQVPTARPTRTGRVWTDCRTNVEINVHYSQNAHSFRNSVVLTRLNRSETHVQPVFLTRFHPYRLASRNYELTHIMSGEFLSPFLCHTSLSYPYLTVLSTFPSFFACRPITLRQFQ